MDYAALILFLALYYIRPQEWFSAFSLVRPIQLLAFLALFAMWQRKKPVRFHDLWSTPQDWMVSAYFAWTVFASPTPGSTFRGILPVIFFYFVGVLTLSSLPRLRTFLTYWAAFILFVAALALASTAGFDPLDSQNLTQGPMKGRLTLNLSIFNNPNGLAHAIVPVIPMLYYLLFWRQTFKKILIVVAIIPIWCILLTLSKGAFLSSAVTIFATLVFGRPRIVQITLIALAITFGGTLLYALPRMNELHSSKADAAIQGRVASFKFGLETMRHKRLGHGLGNFAANFFKYGPTEKVKHKRMSHANGHARLEVYYQNIHYYKAPHSAYNQNGADLGYTGFFLFIGILYSCMRTLITAKTVNNDEESLRRALFAIVVAYAVSAWMVDFCYRPTFFMFIAATSAFHRHLRSSFTRLINLEPEDEEGPVELGWRHRVSPLVCLPAESGNAGILSTQIDTLSLVKAGEQEPQEILTPIDAPCGTIGWQRIGLVDLALSYLLTEGAIRLWIYAINHM
jgi:O-antigen ligase